MGQPWPLASSGQSSKDGGPRQSFTSRVVLVGPDPSGAVAGWRSLAGDPGGAARRMTLGAEKLGWAGKALL